MTADDAGFLFIAGIAWYNLVYMQNKLNRKRHRHCHGMHGQYNLPESRIFRFSIPANAGASGRLRPPEPRWGFTQPPDPWRDWLPPIIYKLPASTKENKNPVMTNNEIIECIIVCLIMLKICHFIVLFLKHPDDRIPLAHMFNKRKSRFHFCFVFLINWMALWSTCKTIKVWDVHVCTSEAIFIRNFMEIWITFYVYLFYVYFFIFDNSKCN